MLEDTRNLVRKTCWWDLPPEHAYKQHPVPIVVTIVGQDAAGSHERVPISPIAPKGEAPKPWEGPYFTYFPYFGGS